MSNLNQSDLISMHQMYNQTFNFDLLDTKNAGHPFYENFKKLSTLDPNSTEYKYIFYNSLFGPLEYINELKKSSEDDYRKWIVRLVKNNNSVGLYGDIFELYINWTLTQKGTQFKKSERPDFEILHNGGKIFIECTSAQFDFDKNPTAKDIKGKIKRTLRNKIVQNYVNFSTSLFVDITNLIYHSKKINLDIDSYFLLEVLKSTYSDLNRNPPSEQIEPIGSIRFFSFNYFKDQFGGTNYACSIIGDFKNPNANINLINFLENNSSEGLEKIQSTNPKFNI